MDEKEMRAPTFGNALDGREAPRPDAQVSYG